MGAATLEEERAESERRRTRVPDEFFEWMEESREIVEANFEELGPEDQAAMTLSLATSLMLTHKLGEIEARLGHIRQEINAKEPN